MKRTVISFLFCVTVFLCIQAKTIAQQSRIDSLFSNADTTAMIDSLLRDFDAFLDSLSRPKSFFTFSATIGTGRFSFENTNSVFFTTRRKAVVAPSLGYFHKNGLGFSLTAYLIHHQSVWTAYQYAFSPSYDMITKTASTGIAYTRYVNRDSLDFYTTPFRNEVFGYYTYKKWWFRPSLSISYGWGSKTDYEKAKFQRYAQLLDQSDNYYIIIKNEERVSDFSLTLSLRKDFDWYDVLFKNDNFTLTPVMLLNSGTQHFGFNTSYNYHLPSSIRVNALPSGSKFSDITAFRLQSVGFVIRGSYLKGRLLLQPQVLLDYNLPISEEKLNTAFSLTAGLHF